LYEKFKKLKFLKINYESAPHGTRLTRYGPGSPFTCEAFEQQNPKGGVIKEGKNYKLIKTEIACIFGAFAFYFPLTIALGALDWASNFVDELPLPEIARAFAFAIILFFPLLLSFFLVTYEILKIGVKITGEEIKSPKREILKAIPLILGPGFYFVFIWLLLIVYLPESLVSKWWFDFMLFVCLTLMFFALSPLFLRSIFIEISQL